VRSRKFAIGKWASPAAAALRGAVAAAITAALLASPGLVAQQPNDAAIASSKPPRPQEEAIARGPRPYTDKEVSFGNEGARLLTPSAMRGQVKLAGTLSVPNGAGPFPGVVLIAAAGPEGRDENAAGHLVFVVLADHLLRQGIAVLRYDKRGVGASTGDLNKASFDDLVSDAAAAFRYLKARPEVDPRRAGVIGHSEGGSIAPAVAALDKDVAFVVAMAGSGLTGKFRLTEQQVNLARENGGSPEQQARIRAMCQQVFRTVETTRDDAAASRQIAALIDATVATKALDPEQAAAFRQLMTPKFVREELNDDPLSYLRKVKVPVLAFVGSLDRIVPAGPYVESMRPVLATIPGSKLQVLPGLNHLMQTAKTGSPREFATIEESISPLALKTIGDWVAERVNQQR
jgi:pimeloyl-ACP methyl ester carboxylesterase